MKSKTITLVVTFLFSVLVTQAQPERFILDEIVAVVGDQIVLKSDVESQMNEFSFPDAKSKWEGQCELVKSAIYQRLLLNQSYIDSLKVEDDEINSEISRRLDYFVSQIGSREALEKYYDKSIAEIKDEMREPIKEMILIRRMKDEVVGSYSISPSEVKKYFNSIPKDSLPYFNTQVEVAQLLIFAQPTAEEHEKAKIKIKEFLDRIKTGTKFETIAILYSEDNGTAVKGGDLGMRSKLDYVPEFSAAALKLKKDSISGIVKTKYGYHLIKMVERKGEKIHVKHILIKPKITIESKLAVQEKLNNLAKQIRNDTLTFASAAFKYSEDEQSRNNGGMLVDVNTGSSKVAVDQLEAALFFVIDTMKVGSIAGPLLTTYPDGRIAYRLIYYKSKTPPHIANLKDDYPEIKEAADNHKKQEMLMNWIDKKMQATYITIHEPYDTCESLKAYLNEAEKD
ncbi:MAG: peptidylprolyl isomerase [Bacteroidetes bacterium]|nr:peptidylprolyl isomerase [Bacteroidota bacterium]MBL6964205.1 peptidylprolyl isomerase [Bacteroidota bacterium]